MTTGAGRRWDRAMGRPVALVLWPVAVAMFIARCVVPAASNILGHHAQYDAFWITALAPFTHGGRPYAIELFVYPPSVLVLALPLAPLSEMAARLSFLAVNAACVVVAAAVLVEIVGIRWKSAGGAVALLLIALAKPVLLTLDYGDVDGPIFALEAAFMVLARRGRWGLAGAALGLSFAIKPVLAMLALILVFDRRFRAVGLAVAIPVALTGIAAAVNSRVLSFATQAVPFLAGGNEASIQGYNVALTGLGLRFGAPVVLVAVGRALVLGILVAAAYAIWRRTADGAQRILEASVALLVASFLAFSFSWPWYALFLLPAVASMALPASRFRSPAAGFALYWLLTGDNWDFRRLGGLGSKLDGARPTVSYLMLTAVLVSDRALWRLPRAAGRPAHAPTAARQPDA